MKNREKSLLLLFIKYLNPGKCIFKHGVRNCEDTSNNSRSSIRNFNPNNHKVITNTQITDANYVNQSRDFSQILKKSH